MLPATTVVEGRRRAADLIVVGATVWATPSCARTRPPSPASKTGARAGGRWHDHFPAVVGGLLLLLLLLLFVLLQPPPAVVGGLLSLFAVLPQSSEALSPTGGIGPVGDDGLQPSTNSDATVSEASKRFMDQVSHGWVVLARAERTVPPPSRSRRSHYEGARLSGG
jgi:hypothetical protein